MFVEYSFKIQGQLIWATHIAIGMFLTYIGFRSLNNKKINKPLSTILICLGFLAVLHHSHLMFYYSNLPKETKSELLSDNLPTKVALLYSPKEEKIEPPDNNSPKEKKIEQPDISRLMFYYSKLPKETKIEQPDDNLPKEEKVEQPDDNLPKEEKVEQPDNNLPKEEKVEQPDISRLMFYYSKLQKKTKIEPQDASQSSK